MLLFNKHPTHIKKYIDIPYNILFTTRFPSYPKMRMFFQVLTKASLYIKRQHNKITSNPLNIQPPEINYRKVIWNMQYQLVPVFYCHGNSWSTCKQGYSSRRSDLTLDHYHYASCFLQTRHAIVNVNVLRN